MNIDMVNRAAAAYLDSVGGTDAERLRFLEGLWQIQSEVELQERPYTAPDAEEARESLLTGQPLFLLAPPAVPLDSYVETVSRLAVYVADEAGLPPGHADALRAADLASAITHERLAIAVQAPDAFVSAVWSATAGSGESALTQVTVAFVLVSALVPFLTMPAEKAMATVGKVTPSLWMTGQCPVCGSAASMGRMGEGSQTQGAERTLWCGLCHSEWDYERIRCVRCGTRNPDSLRYTHLETDPAHRLHLCDECRGYTKFVFRNDLDKPLAMVVEEAVTAPLDAVARARGYSALGGEKSEDAA